MLQLQWLQYMRWKMVSTYCPSMKDQFFRLILLIFNGLNFEPCLVYTLTQLLHVKLFSVYLFSCCFWQFLWCPRPQSFLGLEKDEEIAKNLKKYNAEDQDVSMLLSEKDREKHRMLKNEWNKWVNGWMTGSSWTKLKSRRYWMLQRSDICDNLD